MAKRGERKPWRVRYEWDNGIKGCNAYSSEGHAQLKAQEIRDAAKWRDCEVTVTVENRDA